MNSVEHVGSHSARQGVTMEGMRSLGTRVLEKHLEAEGARTFWFSLEVEEVKAAATGRR
jgi:hypothetical protein